MDPDARRSQIVTLGWAIDGCRNNIRIAEAKIADLRNRVERQTAHLASLEAERMAHEEALEPSPDAGRE